MPLDQPEPEKTPIEERTEELRMTFGEHLEELRSYLIRALIGLLVALVVTIYYGTTIVGWITSPLNQVQVALGLSPQTIATDATAGFVSVYLKVSIISALIVASPWIIYQLWKFVAEGLYDNERKFAYILAPFSTVMTFLGVLFTYYILLPTTLFFFLTFLNSYPNVTTKYTNPMIDILVGTNDVEVVEEEANQEIDVSKITFPTIPVLWEDPVNPPIGAEWFDARDRRRKIWTGKQILSQTYNTNDRIINPLFEINQYISFVTIMALGACVGFQLPVVMLLVGYTRLVDPAHVAAMRKYAFFACFAAGAILTPADVFSMLLLAVPLYFLFEFGLFLMKLVDKPPMSEDDLPS
ncbi:twin-arginine translocase subunit TatC [Planctomycetota bacterium]|nr:twin-arginine translocase subunit TatC [Planctomycetota bacterium]